MPIENATNAGGGTSDTDLDLELDNEQLDLEGEEGSGGESADAAAARAEMEAAARVQGWRPKDSSYTGDPSKWVDAETFLARGRNFTKTLKKDVEALQNQVAEATKTNKALAKFYQETLTRREREFDDQIKALRIQKSAATREGEDEDAIILEDRIEVLKQEKENLKKEVPAEPKPGELSEASKVDPVLTAWIADGNEWFRDDPKMRAYAMAVGEELRVAGNKSSGRPFLDAVRAQMLAEFPGKFQTGNPNRQRAGTVEGGAGGNPATSGKTERDLPLEDRQLMRQFVADGLMTKEQFLKDYNWSKK